MSIPPLLDFSGALPITRLAALRAVIASKFCALDRFEVRLVRAAVRNSAGYRLQSIASLATRSGNGWLYPLLSIFFVMTGRVQHPLRFVGCSAATFLCAFSIYPMFKRFLKRSRPCDYDSTLGGALAPLDRYSCPSGHAMTAAAYCVPVVVACPTALPFAVALCVVISWSRVALGHHYVSDVIVGAALGAAIATPFAILMR